jgi:hypothetical protein
MKALFPFLIALVCLCFSLPKSAVAQCDYIAGDLISQTGQRTPLYSGNSVSGDYVTITFPSEYPIKYTFEVLGSTSSYVHEWDFEADLIFNYTSDYVVTVRITKNAPCGSISQDYQFYPDPYTYSFHFSPKPANNDLLMRAQELLAKANSSSSETGAQLSMATYLASPACDLRKRLA